MTLLVALRGTDGLVLAADSRGTFGDPRGVTAQNDAQHKAHILSNQVAALAAGSGEIASLIIKEVKPRIQAGGIDYVSPVLGVLRDTVRQSYNNWFPNVPAIQPPVLASSGQVPVRPDLAFLLVGYEGDGTPRIFQIASGTDFTAEALKSGKELEPDELRDLVEAARAQLTAE